MASFEVDNGSLHLKFSTLEKLGGLRDGARVPLADVASVEVVDDPWKVLAGLRVGTGMPWVIVLGTMLRSGANDVVAVYGRAPAVVVNLRQGADWQRLLATVPDPHAVAASITSALAAA